jgi:O-methyltransferase
MNNNLNDEIFEKVKNLTLLGKERILANIESVDHIIDNNIDGDIVEIGVYKGGSILSMILRLEEKNVLNKTVHLYDTFEGMTQHSEYDIDLNGSSIKNIPDYICKCDLNSVKQNLKSKTSYPEDFIKYHVGDILKTQFIPEKISILRLDTDWYESTKFELEHFFSKVSKNGIVIVDDYGHWKGCKKAVDEFLINFPEIKIEKIDYTGIKFYKK